MKKIINMLAVAVVAIAVSACGEHTPITTPLRDAQTIAFMAETVTSEAELREVEKLAAGMEHSYRTSFNGAKAREFKRLVEPILNDAGDRRDAYREAEEWLAEQQSTLRGHLNDLETAWSMNLANAEDEWAKIVDKRAEVDVLKVELTSLVERKEQLAVEIMDAGYPESMLNELGELEQAIVAKEEKIAEVIKEEYIIVLAWRLQRGENLLEKMTADVEECVNIEENEEI